MNKPTNDEEFSRIIDLMLNLHSHEKKTGRTDRAAKTARTVRQLHRASWEAPQDKTVGQYLLKI